MSDEKKTIEVEVRGKNNLRGVLGTAKASIRNFVDGTVGNMKRAIGWVFNLKNAIIGLAAAKAFQIIIKPAMEMQDFEAQWTVLLGSAAKAKARMEELTQFSAATPFNLEQITKASKVLETLTAGALSTGAGLTRLGDVAAGTGADIDLLAVHWGRLYDGLMNGTAIGEPLMRLQELGIVSGAVRRKIEAMTKANATGAQMWKVITEATGKYSGMMSLMSGNLSGLFSTLRDNAKLSLGEIGDQIMPVLQANTTSLIAKLEELRASGDLQAFGKAAAEHLQNLLQNLKDMVKWIDANKETIKTVGMTAAGTVVILKAVRAVMDIKMAVNAYILSVNTAVVSTTAMSGALNTEAAAASRAAVATRGLATAKRTAAGATTALSAAFGALAPMVIAAGIGYLVTKMVELKGAINDVESAAEKAGATMKDQSGDEYKPSWMKEAFGGMADFAKDWILKPILPDSLDRKLEQGLNEGRKAMGIDPTTIETGPVSASTRADLKAKGKDKAIDSALEGFFSDLDKGLKDDGMAANAGAAQTKLNSELTSFISQIDAELQSRKQHAEIIRQNQQALDKYNASLEHERRLREGADALAQQQEHINNLAKEKVELQAKADKANADAANPMGAIANNRRAAMEKRRADDAQARQDAEAQKIAARRDRLVAKWGVGAGEKFGRFNAREQILLAKVDAAKAVADKKEQLRLAKNNLQQMDKNQKDVIAKRQADAQKDQQLAMQKNIDKARDQKNEAMAKLTTDALTAMRQQAIAMKETAKKTPTPLEMMAKIKDAMKESQKPMIESMGEIENALSGMRLWNNDARRG